MSDTKERMVIKSGAQMLEEQAEARRQDDLDEAIDDLVQNIAAISEWAVMLRRGSRGHRQEEVDRLVEAAETNVETIRVVTGATGDSEVHALIGADE